MMLKVTPITRITVGLVLIMLSVVLLSDIFGFIPNNDTALKKGRGDLAENLAVEYSIDAQKRNISAIKASMHALVRRNDDVLSAALREKTGALLAIAGDHDKYWTTTGEVSTPENITVPIFNGVRRWGTVEISFVPLHPAGVFGFYIHPLISMTLFVLVFGYIGFMFFIKKTHDHIDPSTFVPSRVKLALDALAEGVLLLDGKGHIMFANTAFGKNMELDPEKILTIKASSIKWEFASSHEDEYPWVKAVETGKTQVGNQLMFSCKSGEKRTFMVNSSPIQDGDGEYRGVLVTFDDITQVEEKNEQLEKMLGLVKKSRDEEKRLKEKMEILATRDPMTNCLNRRSFFDQYEPAFRAAKNSNSQLACIMTDIDLFKSINDNYGHGLGDDVIITVASALQDSMPSADTVCRYGGEEFCIVLPDMSIDEATKAAELARKAIENSGVEDQPKVKFTASFGISTIMNNSGTLSDLIDQADQALYMSKENGRNRVTAWDPSAANKVQDTSSPAEAATPEPSSQQVTIPALTAVESHDAASLASDDMPKPEHDSLTGLPNRRVFYDRVMGAIEHSRGSGQYMAVMMLDLDMFKRINNALGYKVGDDLLLAISQRLQDKLRKTDSVSRLTGEDPTTSIYRLGGDEFGILLSGMECAEITEQIVKRIIDSVTEPLEIDENEIHLTCSMGISIFPGNGIDTDSVLKNAGMALYYAKRHGHNTYQFYDKDNTNVSLEKLKLESDLRYAMERNELSLYYQPKIELHSGKIIGMEGLLRWKHPTLGMIPPVEFIPRAEETGLIHKVGEWVLRTACNQLKEWESTDYKNIAIAVNLSAIQFQKKDLLGNIRRVLDQTGANPKLLELEITESTIMEDLDAAAAIMRELHKEGIRISIDDFGTGYSSLNHLKRFPISTVKVDRSFVSDITTDPDDAAIVGAIIVMAHGMGLRIIAEGVETEQQLEYLRRLRCDEVQGFLFSQALPKDEIEKFLEQDKDGTAFIDTESRAVS